MTEGYRRSRSKSGGKRCHLCEQKGNLSRSQALHLVKKRKIESLRPCPQKTINNDHHVISKLRSDPSDDDVIELTGEERITLISILNTHVDKEYVFPLCKKQEIPIMNSGKQKLYTSKSNSHCLLPMTGSKWGRYQRCCCYLLDINKLKNVKEPRRVPVKDLRTKRRSCMIKREDNVLLDDLSIEDIVLVVSKLDKYVDERFCFPIQQPTPSTKHISANNTLISATTKTRTYTKKASTANVSYADALQAMLESVHGPAGVNAVSDMLEDQRKDDIESARTSIGDHIHIFSSSEGAIDYSHAGANMAVKDSQVPKRQWEGEYNSSEEQARALKMSAVVLSGYDISTQARVWAKITDTSKVISKVSSHPSTDQPYSKKTLSKHPLISVSRSLQA
eukprot:CFRG2586T1